MSRNLEWVYKSDGTELSTTTLSTSVANASYLIDDGTYIWATCGTDGIAIYQYFGASTDDEPSWDELDFTNYTRYDSGLNKKLRLVTFIKVTATQILRTTCIPALSLFPALSPSDPDGTYTISSTSVIVKTLDSGERAITTAIARSGTALNAQYIATDGTKMYIANGVAFSEVMSFDIATQDFSAVIVMADPVSGVAVTMNSNLCVADGKLWGVGTAYDDSTPQKLHSYNLSTAAKVNTSIPVRPGSARSWIADGFNGSVYVTNYNNLSVTRFSYANVLGATIRVNSSPTRVFGFPSKKILVSSYAGMLSGIDWDDDGVHNDWSTETACISLNYDPYDTSQIWFTNAGGVVVKQDVNDNTQVEISLEEDDWIYTSDRLVQSVKGEAFSVLKNASKTLVNTNLVSNTYFDGSKTFHPDVVVKNSAGTVTLVEHFDYTVNLATGTLQFLSTSTVVTSPTVATALKVDYEFNSFSAVYSLVSEPKTYTSGGTITVHPYLFVLSHNMLLASRLDTYLTKLPAETAVTSQGAVVAGTNQYFGD